MQNVKKNDLCRFFQNSSNCKNLNKPIPQQAGEQHTQKSKKRPKNDLLIWNINNLCEKLHQKYLKL